MRGAKKCLLLPRRKPRATAHSVSGDRVPVPFRVVHVRQHVVHYRVGPEVNESIGTRLDQHLLARRIARRGRCVAVITGGSRSRAKGLLSDRFV